MSIADRFDHRSDAGFVRAYDAHAARRQFQISFVLVAVLALAAVTLGVLARLDRPTVGGGLRPSPRAALTSRKLYWT